MMHILYVASRDAIKFVSTCDVLVCSICHYLMNVAKSVSCVSNVGGLL
jgi:hypothetical protein